MQNAQIIFEKNDGKPAEVSVVITLFNYGRLVEDTLNSLLRQTLGCFDLIIAEDCSTDDSLSVAERWLRQNAERFNRISLVHHLQNQGLGITRNTAFRHTDTPFVFVLDADNLLYPKALEKLLGGLKNSKADFAFCYLEHFGDTAKLGGLQPWNPKSLIYGNTIDAMVLMKKTIWETVGGYSEDMPYNGWEDYELWFKIAEKGGWGIRIPEILCRYRVHSSSMLNVETNLKVSELTTYLRKKHKEFFARGLIEKE